MTAKIIAYILLGICIGPIFSIGVTPIFCVLRKIFYVPFIRKKLVEKAKEDGHVVEATLQKSHDLVDSELMPTMNKMGTYIYYVNGRKYKYHYITENRLNEKLTLYYIKKPRKATVSADIGSWESPWFKIYLAISLVIAILVFCGGMMIG